MLSLLVLITVLAIDGVFSLHCRVVEEGNHYPTDPPHPHEKNQLVIHTHIRFNHDTAHYLFSPTNVHGHRCSESWNQAWGATRCGYETSNHQDSDRFVWRRATTCLIYDSQGHVIGVKPNCPDANLIEIAAYAYDHGLKPFQHLGTLLKQFSTKLHIDRWYKFTLTFHPTKTVYRLADEHDRSIETQTIDHRTCHEFNHGTMQGFYFGGICPAPQTVSVCYK